ncbi:inner membrane protein YghB [bacterium BMS3Abin07]|nr:inner membrane protein YghB [bacterium BMS3Abin07]HDO21458.1 phosphatase PAP2 family protein [Nitrospirota bacterium]HDZ88188.1 phosphatase PAP2 family protein [Nitrospirota bacterium]
MFEKLLNTISLLGHWGYLVIFLAAFLESSAFMGLLVPGESVVVLSGFLASQGYLDIGDCLWVIVLGAVLGDSVGYSLGKVIGRGYFEKHHRLLLLKEKHIQKVDKYFERHGGKTVFWGRFIGFLRAMAPFVAGMSRMPYRSFVFYNVSGGILWSVSFTLLGYFFGQSWQLIEKWSGRAGVFVLFMFLVVAGFGYLYRTITRRQAEIYEWFQNKYTQFINSLRIRSFIKHHPGIVLFIRERLSPGSYLGLHLTVGLGISAVFVWIFGGITEDILTGDPFVVVDQWVLNHILYFRTPMVTGFMIGFTHLGGGIMVMTGSLVIIAFLLFKRRFDYLVTYISSIIGGSLLVYVLKIAIQRPRPISGTSLISAWGWSFPSGHAMMSVIFYGMITYFISRDIRSWRLRILLAIIAGFVVFLIGFSRIYLQVHYLSDVLAGYTGGFFWLSICITGLEAYRKKVSFQKS